jgi:protein gp37
MSDKSKIEWTDATWNPVTGCSKVSEGCRNCYAMKFAERWRGIPGHYFENGFDITLRPDKLDEPLRWRRPRRIFVNSMSDLFHDQVPVTFIHEVFKVMAEANWHTFQILTKRPARMAEVMQTLRPLFEGMVFNGSKVEWPLPNVWLGVSVENQKSADERIPLLLQTPAAVRFLSCEPLLGPVDPTRIAPMDSENREGAIAGDALAGGLWEKKGHAERWHQIQKGPAIDWVIVGGESGPGARPVHPEWVRSLRDQCQAAGVPFFFKQWGEWAPGSNFPDHIPSGTSHNFGEELDDNRAVWKVGKKAAGRMLDGRAWDEFPSIHVTSTITASQKNKNSPRSKRRSGPTDTEATISL